LAWDSFPTDYINNIGDTIIFEPVCSGHSFLSDGKLLIAGGEPKDNIYGAWKFDPIAEIWERTTGDMTVPRWYPTVLTLGDDSGRVLVVSGVYNAASPPIMEIYSENTDSFSFSDLNTGSWTDIGENFRSKGMSLLMLRQEPTESDRIMTVGGGISSDMATSQVIDISTMSPVWGAKTSMNHARRNVNVVQLPDGTVFACGGVDEMSNPVFPSELYNLKTNTWLPMDSLVLERAYHAVAVLLPNGKVMTTGGGNDCRLSFNSSLEIFSPPYLFNHDGTEATRPEIISFPDPEAGEIVLHGSTFEICTHDPCNISKVVMVRPMAVTHQTDTEQRVMQLTFTQSGTDKLNVTAPDGRVYPYGAGGNHMHAVATRGYYMLFILNNNGVPSIAKFIRLR